MAEVSVTMVPCLGTLGWVSDLNNKLDILLGHFFLADYNQTYLYPGEVTSLPRILEKNSYKARGCDSDIKEGLKQYLKRYFNSVEVDVAIANEDTNSTINDTLIVQISVMDNGYSKVSGWDINAATGKFQRVVRANAG
jgi:hypothetical protein